MAIQLTNNQNSNRIDPLINKKNIQPEQVTKEKLVNDELFTPKNEKQLSAGALKNKAATYHDNRAGSLLKNMPGNGFDPSKIIYKLVNNGVVGTEDTLANNGVVETDNTLAGNGIVGTDQTLAGSGVVETGNTLAGSGVVKTGDTLPIQS